MDEQLLQSVDLKLSLIHNLLETKMNQLIKITAADLVKDKPVNQQIEILSKIGMNTSEIATYLDKTPNAVRVILHRKRETKKQENKHAR